MPSTPVRLRIPSTAGWVRTAVDRLRSGSVVAVPTETFYGLAGDPRRSEVVERVLALKGHGPDRSLLLLAADRSQVEALAPLEGLPEAGRLAAAFWPGPLTLVLPLRADLPACPRGTVAIRVPGLEVPRLLAGGLGHPITGTSANRAGREPASSPDRVQADLGEGVDLILDAGPTPGGVPSSLVDLLGAAPRLLREGRISGAEIEAVLGRSLSAR